jgi:hypothetical protein
MSMPLRVRLTPLVVVLIGFGVMGALGYDIFHTSMPSAPDPKTGQIVQMHTRRGELYYARSADVVFQYGAPFIIVGLLGAWIWYVKRAPYDPDSGEN